MARALLVEILTTSPAGVAATQRFTDRVIAPLPPADADRPNVGYDDRLLESPSLARSLFSDPTALKPSIGLGMLTLANADGVLNGLQGHVWGEITVRDWAVGSAFSTAAVLLKGLCHVPAFTGSTDQARRVKCALFDYGIELSKPLQTVLYAGTNGVGGVLYEGAADGLKGSPKPLAFGNLLGAQIPAPQVNAGAGVSQLHDGPVAGFELLFDRGDAAGIAGSGNLAGAAFDAAAPAAAHYVTDLARGLVKINAAPVGKLTFGFKGDAPAVGGYAETAGPIAARILARAGVPAGRIGASIAALASTAVVGLYVANQETAQDLIALLGASVLAAILPDRQGVWQAVPFGPPNPDAVALAISADQVIALSPDEAAPLPVGEIRVGWGRIYTTFAGTELAPALVGTAAQARLAAEYRWAVQADATVKARLPSTWRTIELPTALRVEADAQALALQLKAMFGLRPDGSPRRQWRLTLLREDAAGVQLGQTVRLTYPLREIADNFLLIGEEPMRPRRDQVIWTLWG